jgi:hypothetical protein
VQCATQSVAQEGVFVVQRASQSVAQEGVFAVQCNGPRKAWLKRGCSQCSVPRKASLKRECLRCSGRGLFVGAKQCNARGAANAEAWQARASQGWASQGEAKARRARRVCAYNYMFVCHSMVAERREARTVIRFVAEVRT